MFDRLLSFIGGVPGALWRNTAGRLFGSGSSAPEVERRTPMIEPTEPRSVAGIAFRASLVVLGVVFAAYLIYELRLLLILVFLAVLLAAGLYGVVRFFERFLPRVLAVLVSYFLLIGAFALVLFLIFPPLVRQAVDLADDFPRILDELRAGAISLIDQVAPGNGREVVDGLTAGTEGGLPEVGSLLSVPLTVASVLTNLLVVVFLSALILIERDRTRGYLLNYVEVQDRDAVMESARRALLKLGAYVRGQLLVMTVIGVGSVIGLVVVGYLVRGSPMPFAIPLGALSFITAAIPLAGAFLAGGLIVLVSLTVSPIAALLMLVWVVILQQLEGSVITPYIQGKVVNLSAVVVLLAVVAGTSLAGIVGGIIAIPLVAVIDVVIRDVVFPLRRRAEERRRHPESPGL